MSGAFQTGQPYGEAAPHAAILFRKTDPHSRISRSTPVLGEFLSRIDVLNDSDIIGRPLQHIGSPTEHRTCADISGEVLDHCLKVARNHDGVPASTVQSRN